MGTTNKHGIEFLDDLGRRITQLLMTTARKPSSINGCLCSDPALQRGTFKHTTHEDEF